MNQHAANGQVGFLKCTLRDSQPIHKYSVPNASHKLFSLQSVETCSIITSLVNTCTESLEMVDQKDIPNLMKMHN